MEMLNLKESINRISFGNTRENERVQNLLHKEGISTIEKLCQKTRADLQSIGKIGDVTINLIDCSLEKYGLHLGMTPLECGIYNKRKYFELLSDDIFINDFDLMLDEEEENIRFDDQDLTPEESEDEDGCEDDCECRHRIVLHIHNKLQMPEKEAGPIDWEARFYEVAKEEFLRQNPVFSWEKCADRAICAASVFIEKMKAYQSKEKTS